MCRQRDNFHAYYYCRGSDLAWNQAFTRLRCREHPTHPQTTSDVVEVGLADRLRVRWSSSYERVVGQSGSLTKRRPLVATLDGGVGVVIRRQMLRACCTQHAQLQSRPAAVGSNLFTNCRSCVVPPHGWRSASAGPKETYIVLASGCCEYSWRTPWARGAAVGVVLKLPSPVTGLFGVLWPFGLLWRHTP